MMDPIIEMAQDDEVSIEDIYHAILRSTKYLDWLKVEKRITKREPRI